MRFSAAVACASFIASLTASAAPALFPKLVSQDEAFSAPLDEHEFDVESAALAKAASLKNPQSSGNFELRITRIGIHGDGEALLISDRHLRVFDFHHSSSGRFRVHKVAIRSIDARMLPMAEVRAIKGLAGRSVGCPAVDGPSVSIDASLDGVPIHVRADDPVMCNTPNNNRITALLNAVDALSK